MLETNRLVLRQFTNTPADLQALFAIMSDPHVNQFLPWLPLKNITEAASFFDERFAPVKAKGELYLAICLKATNQPIGYLTVGSAPSFDFGYGLKKAFWNQGIVTEAASAVINYLAEKNYSFITATHDINNPASGKVMEKIGMAYRYTYKEQWQPKNFPVLFRMYQFDFAQNIPTFAGYWQQSSEHFVETLETEN